MAFGRLTTKFQIFRKNLNCALEKNAQICLVCAMLHNFVIENDNIVFKRSAVGSLNMQDFGAMPFSESRGPGPTGFIPSTILGEDGNEEMHLIEPENDKQQRDIVAAITEHDLRRPEHNILRNGDNIVIDKDGKHM